MPKFSSNEKKPRSYFSDVSFGFKDCDDAGPEDGQRRDVVGEDAERAGERGNVDLLHGSVLKRIEQLEGLIQSFSSRARNTATTIQQYFCFKPISRIKQ